MGATETYRSFTSASQATSNAFPPRGSVPVTVVILTYDEEINVADCIRSCSWCDDVHVLDSNSTDRTAEIARENGAAVHTHAFESFGRQRNWAIKNITHRHDWVFHLDADERFTPELVEEIRQVISADAPEAGFYVPNKLMFMGRWLKHSSGYPIYQMRLFHKDRMLFCDYGHGQREQTKGRIGELSQPYFHLNFSKGISDWLSRHNRYSTLEAEAIVSGQRGGGALVHGSLFGSTIQRRRFFKGQVYPNLPSKWIWRFVYMYFLKLGIFDGLPGLQYSLLVAAYELFISLKVSELRRRAAKQPGTQTPTRISSPSAVAENIEPNAPADGGVIPIIALMAQRNTSPWTLREKVGRALWMLSSALLFRLSFHNWYAWRRTLLRLFGAKVGRGVRIRPTASIEIPWNLEIGEYAVVGDYAILYSLGRISLGRMCVISQYAHLCAGTHDYTDPTFPLLRLPITVGDEVWVAADAFIGPGVTIGARTVVGARATVVKDVPGGEIVVGNPARCVKRRSATSPDSDRSG